MADTTVNLQMPYILPSQAQQHVTDNEALQRLDVAIQLVLQAQLAAPPVSVAEGACYAIKTPAAGDWSGQSGNSFGSLIIWSDRFLFPRMRASIAYDEPVRDQQDISVDGPFSYPPAGSAQCATRPR